MANISQTQEAPTENPTSLAVSNQKKRVPARSGNWSRRDAPVKRTYMQLMIEGLISEHLVVH